MKKPDYKSQKKEILLSEAEARGITGLTPKSLHEDIVAALELKDEQDIQDKAAKSNLPDAPHQADVPEGDVVKSNPPQNTDFVKGRYVMREGNHIGEEFALAVHEPDSYERTHTLKNKEHFWQGTEKQFRIAFEKK